MNTGGCVLGALILIKGVSGLALHSITAGGWVGKVGENRGGSQK